MAPKRPKQASDKNGVEKSASFKWSPEVKKKMASYINEHFTSYKVQKRIAFLRTMRDKLELVQLTDVQLKNGLRALLAKYQEIKDKLKSSGFGVDPDVDATLDKGWILRECPYFEILDEVLGTRPNVTPPFLVDSGLSEPEAPQMTTSADRANIHDLIEMNSDVETEDDPEPTSNEREVTEEPSTSSVAGFVRSAMAGIGVQKKVDTGPKTALGCFSKIIGDKLKEQKEIELQKHSLEVQKFEHTKKLDEEMLNNELLKGVDKEVQLKLVEDRQHEREFQLAKLKLEIELERMRKQ